MVMNVWNDSELTPDEVWMTSSPTENQQGCLTKQINCTQVNCSLFNDTHFNGIQNYNNPYNRYMKHVLVDSFWHLVAKVGYVDTFF